MYVCLQVLALGLRPKKDAKVRKYWNWYHHWVGRLALFLAVINIFVGLHMGRAERDFKVGYIAILSIELAAFVILELLLWLRWNRQRQVTRILLPPRTIFTSVEMYKKKVGTLNSFLSLRLPVLWRCQTGLDDLAYDHT